MEPLPEDSKRVEFRGLPSPFAHPEVQRRMRLGLVTPAGRAELWRLERERQQWGFARFLGRTKLTLDQRHGLSRPYVWGPREYTVLMAPADIRVLMAMHPFHRQAFHVVDDLIVIGSRSNRPGAGEDSSYARHATV